MPVIKQKTLDDGTTLQLNRYRTQKPGKQYEYYVTESDGGRIDDPVYTKEAAMRQFRETVSAYQNTIEDDRGGGMLGMGGDMGLPAFDDGDVQPIIPEMEDPFMRDDAQEDDEGFNFPGF